MFQARFVCLLLVAFIVFPYGRLLVAQSRSMKGRSLASGPVVLANTSDDPDDDGDDEGDMSNMCFKPGGQE